MYIVYDYVYRDDDYYDIPILLCAGLQGNVAIPVIVSYNYIIISKE